MTQLIIWGVLFIGLIILESVTAQMVSVWFALGSLAAFITAIFSDSFVVELIVFILVSVILLIFTRPFVKKYLITKKCPTNADMALGQEGIVIQEIDNLRGVGRIMLHGQSWNARTEDDSVVAKDQKVTVIRIEGVTAYVKPVQ